MGFQLCLSWIGLIIIAVSMSACNISKNSVTRLPSAAMVKTDSFLENLLSRHPSAFNHILNNRDSFRIQIIYTQINRNRRNKPEFKNYYFNVNPQTYFYPASTVKMPVALLSLEWLNNLNNEHVNGTTTMITGKAGNVQTEVFNDPTSEDGRPTISHYIKKIFLISDNDAYNRLYELLGPDYIKKNLERKGFKETEIVHRLSVPLSPREHLETNPVTFFDTSMRQVLAKPHYTGNLQAAGRNIHLGKGYRLDGQLIKQPFDFSLKNRLTLEDLHRMIQTVMFPESFRKRNRFNISGEDYRFVWQYMSQYPSETSFPPYDSSSFYDAYCKFLFWGSEKEILPKHLRIFNKVGDAYGFLTDAAYIADFENNVEFILSATIYCNNDGIFNDDQYDYESVGFPFMKQLGRTIYNYELARRKKYSPDLNQFKLKYK